MTTVKTRHAETRKENRRVPAPELKLGDILNSPLVVTPAQQAQVVKYLLRAVDSPRALTVWLLFSNGEHEQLVELACDPLQYGSLGLGIEKDALDFRDDYYATELLSKADFLKLPFDKTERALEKFLKAEERCSATNKRLTRFESGLFTGESNERDGYKTPVLGSEDRLRAAILTGMQLKLETWLGEFDAEEFVDACGWGPGSTYFLPRRYASQYNKFLKERGCTTKCRTFISSWFLSAFPLWGKSLGLTDGLASEFPAEIAPGNKVITVKKNAKTDRVICIEPGLNLWFQKGLGRMLRRRLRKAGNSIDTQVRNQTLCRQAVKLGLATVDFRAASDTIARKLIELLLPNTWRTVFDVFRSAVGVMPDGSEVSWEKYSTMGNGFTFELETMVFRALADTVCEMLRLPTRNVSVFGDDVLLPGAALPLFTEMANFIGFEVNDEKTHCSSLFRESCGVHYYEEVCTKPLYVRELVSSVPAAYSLANGIRGLSHRSCGLDGCDIRYQRAWRDTVGWIPKELRFFGPVSLGDIVLHANDDEASTHVSRRGFEGVLIRGLKFKPSKFRMRQYLPAVCRNLLRVKGSTWPQFSGGPHHVSWAVRTLPHFDGLLTRIPGQATRSLLGFEEWRRSHFLGAIAKETAIRVKCEDELEEMAMTFSQENNGRGSYVINPEILVYNWYDLGPWRKPH